MAKTIHKFRLQLTDSQTLQLPSSAKPLSVQIQAGQICLWAEVDCDLEENKDVVISIVPTGYEVPPGAVYYLGTVQAEGNYVWHVYASTAMGERR